jgi:hypothetical protein
MAITLPDATLVQNNIDNSPCRDHDQIEKCRKHKEVKCHRFATENASITTRPQ